MDGLRFDWTVTFGTIVQLVAFIGMGLFAWFGFKSKIEMVLQKEDIIVEQHTGLLSELARQLKEHEHKDAEMFNNIKDRMTDLVGGVQRLVGQNEVFRRDRDDRRIQS